MTADPVLVADTSASARIVNAMSVDVEDYFQVGAFENCIARDAWNQFPARVDHNTNRLLDLFDEKGIKSTFFTLAWVAERQPKLIRRIVERGHELASHGYAHDRVTSFERTSFAADLNKSRAILEDIGGVAIRGYRAPSFSIGERNAWALEVLADHGYAYSSSVNPIRHDHYGWVGAPRFAYHPVAGSDMIEIPVSTIELAGRRIACGGGGYFRLLPYAAFAWALRRLNQRDQAPSIFYFHPWEIDPAQQRIGNASALSKFRHYTNLDRMEAKLTTLLEEFAWDRVDAVFLSGGKPSGTAG
jgi:polysaccharide deacetylase family protein (PEP-CTERM system associated)